MKSQKKSDQQSNKKAKTNTGSKKDGKKKIPVWLIMAGIIVVIAGIWAGQKYYTNSQQQSLLEAAEKTGIYQGVSNKHRVVLDSSSYQFRERKQVRDAMGFRSTRTIMSYGAAKKHPQVLDQIFCFCNCDKSIGHKSLLSCFADNHASMCGICQDEALLATKMAEDGESMVAIIDAIDNQFN